jgi:hypothetical protein
MGDDDQLDLLYLSTGSGGFYQPEYRLEQNLQNGQTKTSKVTYRWAGRTSYINLPWPTQAVPLKATLHASAPRPNRDPDKGGTKLKVTGLLEWDKQDLGEFDLTGLYEGSDYVFKIPVHLRPNLALLSLKFETSDLYPSEYSHDPRGLSVIFFSLKLEPDYADFGWRGWLATLARPGLLAIIVFCIGGLASLILQNSRRALLCQALAGLALLLTMFLWPLAAEPIYAAWAFITLFAWGLTGLAVLFARRAVNLPAPFVFAATLFPLLPLAQFAFGRLDLYSLNPSSVIIGLYSCALLSGAAFYINSRTNPDPTIFERAFERAILFASMISFAYAHFSIWQIDLYRGSDFKLYYQTTSHNLYQIAEPIPPALVVILWPFQRIFGNDLGTALVVWRLFNGLLLLICLLLLVQIFGGKEQGKRLTLIVLFFFLNFGQIAESIAYGQYTIVLLLGVTVLAWGIKYQKSGWAGLAMGLLVSLKPYFGLALLAVVNRGKISLVAFRAMVAGWLGWLLLSGLVMNWGSLPFYFSRIGAEFSDPALSLSNQSWWGFLGRLALPHAEENTLGDLPFWLILAGYSGLLLALGVIFYLLWKTRFLPGSTSNLLKLGILLLTALLVAPVFSMPTILITLLPLLALLMVWNTARLRPLARWQLVLFAVTYGMLAYGGRYDFFQDQVAGLARLGGSYRFLAILGLWGLCLWELRANLHSHKA